MKKFQYIVEDIMDDVDLQAYLNEHGENGWNLVQVKYVRGSVCSFYKIFLVKEIENVQP